MSVRKKLDRTVTALENGKTKIVGLYDLLNGLSVRNKASFDVTLKSESSVFPVWKKSMGYNKEFRIMPVIWVLVGLVALKAAMTVGKHCN